MGIILLHRKINSAVNVIVTEKKTNILMMNFFLDHFSFYETNNP